MPRFILSGPRKFACNITRLKAWSPTACRLFQSLLRGPFVRS